MGSNNSVSQIRKKESRYKNQFFSISIALIIAIACFALPRVQPYFFSFEHKYADWRTALFSPHLDTFHDQIVIVKITEVELEKMRYRSPLDREYLSKLIEVIDAAAPKVISLDVLFDQSTEREKDAQLIATIKNAKTPIVLADADDRYFMSDRQRTYLSNFISGSGATSGYVNMITDEDGVVRELPRGRSQEYWVSFAQQASKISSNTETPKSSWSEKISWLRRPPKSSGDIFQNFNAEFILAAPQVAAPLLKDKIVIIGAVLNDTDKHLTPFSVLGQVKKGMSGTQIHAQIIAQFLDKRRTQMFPRWAESILYFLTAIIGLRLARSEKAVAKKAIIFSFLGIAAIIIDVLVFITVSTLIPTAMILLCMSLAFGLPGLYLNLKVWLKKFNKAKP